MEEIREGGGKPKPERNLFDTMFDPRFEVKE